MSKNLHYNIQSKNEKVTWPQEWSSSFYLTIKSTAFENYTELWTYDIFDVINGIAVIIGLLLGWSCFEILYKTAKIIIEKFSCGPGKISLCIVSVCHYIKLGVGMG